MGAQLTFKIDTARLKHTDKQENKHEDKHRDKHKDTRLFSATSQQLTFQVDTKNVNMAM